MALPKWIYADPDYLTKEQGRIARLWETMQVIEAFAPNIERNPNSAWLGISMSQGKKASLNALATIIRISPQIDHPYMAWANSFQGGLSADETGKLGMIVNIPRNILEMLSKAALNEEM